ncbi:chemotaxis response regulator protein-glutamate methylesterase [Aurantimonas sp. Leaf443]|uniref:protein-glutamate methylesterase/protein-glutamine glutaminase n=1 Tax=Aurantimonas sp. Leaf443 TaxID=1736378 RepID=UPI0006F65FC0|nr:chemotaxis response regulator protein-glutamate methylesterase [Aurantimonas sp. Leaf443]KQT86118.1 chemotaxis protein [Aurantimonas sp. Leaf443]
MTKVRALVVDDSATMRMLIAKTLGADPQIEVVGFAKDPIEARAEIKRLDPDVITLDVEMPRMQGTEFLAHLMRLRPMPVVMVSTLTGPGTATAIEALSIGAYDCFAKPSGTSTRAFDGLAAMVKEAAGAKRSIVALAARQNESRQAAARPAAETAASGGPAAIVIAASTGGIEAISTVLSQWPKDCPPTFVVQHLPAGFTKGFAARLDAISPAEVAEARDGERAARGRVYIAPAGASHLLVGGLHPACMLRSADPVSGHRPAADVLFSSAASAYGAELLGIVLTGMGADGAKGLLAIRKAGGATIGQDEATSLVYGMPKAAFQLGAVERQLPLARIAQAAFNLERAEASPCP